MKTQNKLIARIFEDVGGYYICDNSLSYLDTRGLNHKTKADAMRSAKYNGYTHAFGSGTYKKGITKL